MSAGRQGTEEPPGNDGQQVVPAAAHAAGMFLDQLAERNAHRLFDVARRVHMAGNAEELGAGVARVAADAGEPGGAAAQDRRHDGNGFDIVDGRRATVEAGVRGKWRLEARLALLALQALQQGRFLAADIGAGAAMDVNVEVPARAAGVPADQSGLVGLVDRGLQPLGLAVEFAADVDVRGIRAHGETGDQAALDQLVRIVAHDVPVLAGAGLGFVGVDDQIVRTAVALVVRRHEGPFEPGREAGAAPAAQAPIP